MKTLGIITASVTLVLLTFAVLFLAMVGALFLLSERQLTTAEHCPKIVRSEHNKLLCIVEMQAEDDNLMIIRDAKETKL